MHSLYNQDLSQMRTAEEQGTDFQDMDMSTPQALTELRVNGVFTLAAPVLQIDDKFYTVEDLFDGETIKDLQVQGILPS
jgi:hypothetical protein